MVVVAVMATEATPWHARGVVWATVVVVTAKNHRQVWRYELMMTMHVSMVGICMHAGDGSGARVEQGKQE